MPSLLEDNVLLQCLESWPYMITQVSEGSEDIFV